MMDKEKKPASALMPLILRAIALAMGVAVVVLYAMKAADGSSTSIMLGIGLACMALSVLTDKKE